MPTHDLTRDIRLDKAMFSWDAHFLSDLSLGASLKMKRNIFDGRTCELYIKQFFTFVLPIFDKLG